MMGDLSELPGHYTCMSVTCCFVCLFICFLLIARIVTEYLKTMACSYLVFHYAEEEMREIE